MNRKAEFVSAAFNQPCCEIYFNTKHSFVIIESIYGNVVNIAQSTRDAASELVIANRHQKNARKNMCCLLLIIVVVACVLTLILVVAK